MLLSLESPLRKPLLLLCAVLSLAVFHPLASAGIRAQAPAPDTAWQFSIPLEPGTERHAYLWIPPHCERVRGVFLGLQNMLERSLFEDPTIREAVSAECLAIVWVSPGAASGDNAQALEPTLAFAPKQDAIAAVQRILAGLARESGYTELENAPLLVTGHSAASPFVWGMAQELPGRVFAALPFKGYPVGPAPANVPTLKVEQEWAEWGPNWGEVWRNDLQLAATSQRQSPNALMGDLVDLGAGHFDWHHDAAPIVALFLRKAAVRRLPAEIPLTGPVALRPIEIASGVLVDPETLGTARFRAVPYSAWKGDPKAAFWYFDAELAGAINSYMGTRLAKQPEAIDFVVGGKPVPLTANGFAALKPEFLPDGIHFRVHAEPLPASPSRSLYGGSALGHAQTPIVYRVGSGALLQTGADTFMVADRPGGLTRQGLPWEPWIIAYQPGDNTFRSTDRPAHMLIDVRNKKGEPQTLVFEQPDDIEFPASTQTASMIELHAHASSGLPVQLFVESGPAVLDGNTLRLLPIPPRSRYPVKIIVSAYQWGRVGEHAVQSAGPVTREIYIRRR